MNKKIQYKPFKENPDFPKNIMVEVSNICNHRCIFCSNRDSRRNKQLIDKTLAERIIREAFEYGARKISFHGMGEPLINPNLIHYVELAKNIGYDYIYIDTNGSLAVPEKINPIIDAGLDSIKISISAMNRDTFIKVQGKDDFNQVISNIDNLIKYKSKRQFKLYLDFVELIDNAGQGERLFQKYRSLVDDIWISECITQGGNITDRLKDISGKSVEELVESWVCKDPFERLIITADGYATACCMDNDNNLAFADLNEGWGDLSTVWKRGTAIRKQHLSGENVNIYCQRCEAIKYYEMKEIN